MTPEARAPQHIGGRWYACIHCGTPVEWCGRGRHPMYCSDPCKWRSRGERVRKDSPHGCLIEGCSRPHHGRGLCKPHWKQWDRSVSDHRPPSDQWSERRRHNYHSRRAKGIRTGLRGSERVLYEQIVARDGYGCQRCGELVDMTLEYPDRWSKSIDHIVPVSAGGKHLLANVQMMHFWCNSAKGSKQ